MESPLPERKSPAAEIKTEKDEIVIEEEEIEGNSSSFPFQKIIQLITDLDKGEGVFIEELFGKISFGKNRGIIRKNVGKWEYFPKSPYRVRVL